MYIRVTISAVIGKNRQSYAIGTNIEGDGKLRVEINKDVDWTKPIFMILEPDDPKVLNPSSVTTVTSGPSRYCTQCSWESWKGDHKGECLGEEKEA